MFRVAGGVGSFKYKLHILSALINGELHTKAADCHAITL